MSKIKDKLVYIEASGINKPLYQAIIDGDIGSSPDATSSVKGKLKLAGDLGGTADLPTVPELVNKAPLSNPEFSGAVYLGAESVDGSWRLRVDAGELKIETRIAGVWTTKDTIQP